MTRANPAAPHNTARGNDLASADGFHTEGPTMPKASFLGAASLAEALATAAGPVHARAFMPGDAPAKAGDVVGGASATISCGDARVVYASPHRRC